MLTAHVSLATATRATSEMRDSIFHGEGKSNLSLPFYFGIFMALSLYLEIYRLIA